MLSSHNFCDGENCSHFNRSKAEALCRAKKRVIKTIKIGRIDILLKEAERRKVDLRVLLYFRDARPVYLSRKKADELGEPTYYLNIARYCSLKLNQFNIYAENLSLHSRLKSVKFEEIAENPEIEANIIYEYLKWDVPANLHSWIEKNTQTTSGGTFGTSRNSIEKISEWREKIEEEEKFLVDTICKDYLNALNYN
ncbi:unnamed protein product [Oikopleura dioica]|uniref:Sulfotransferase n=1 Tax=Oikopleura dioica TaxID=34765 RepID=E4XL75_OIKDI|nr:unnamed protein product [Oikopleura dioica]